MAWLSRSLGDSVSSLTGQLSTLTKDILTEGTEEVSDHATELSLAKERIASLESIQAAQKTENERLKKLNRELEEKAESAELQINSISREYRAVLEEREKEVNTLKQHHHELLEQHAKGALHSPGDTTAAHSASGVEQTGSLQEEGFEGWSNESWGEFDDSLRLQREINNLRQEVTRLRADSQHWRSVAGQLSEKDGQNLDQSAQHDLLNLQAKVKEFEQKASDSREQSQHEVASLQDVHRSKTAALKKKHKEEITQLQSQLSSFEQQLADARDGESTGTGGSSSVLPESERAESEVERNLQSQLAAVTKEKDKVLTAKSHLEGVLQELQGEVEVMQTHRHHSQQQVAALETRLQEAESQRAEADERRKQVGLDVVKAKRCLLDQLEANHADTADLLSDVRGVRQQLCVEALHRQRHLVVERNNLANRMYAAGLQESNLKASIAETGTELQQASADMEDLIEQIGEDDVRQHISSVFASLEKENLVLKEQSLKHKEQITLLEKRLTNQQQEWQDSRQSVASLKQELHELRGGKAGSDTTDNNTLNQSLTTVSDARSRSSGSSSSDQANREDQDMDMQIQREALEEVLAQLRQELREKDAKIDQLSSSSGGGGGAGVSRGEDSASATTKENQSLHSELLLLRDSLSSLQKEKKELEKKETGENRSLHSELESLRDSLSSLQKENEDNQSLKSELLSVRDSLSSLQKEKEEVLKEKDEVQKEKDEVQKEKDELEESIGELDEQHQEATDHLISARNAMQTQLADSHKQVKTLEEELMNLSQQQQEQSTLDTSSATTSSQQVEQLQTDLLKSQKQVESLRQQAEVRERELGEVRVNLQKGTLALNDLHMDKKDLEEALAKVKDEVKVKVAAIKTLREEKANLTKENKELEERLQDMEEELDSWEQRNEQAQLGGGSVGDGAKLHAKLQEEITGLQAEVSGLQAHVSELQAEVSGPQAQVSELQAEVSGLQAEVSGLQAQVSELQADNSQQREKLDAMFVELDASRGLCKKLEREREGLDQELGRLRETGQERDNKALVALKAEGDRKDREIDILRSAADERDAALDRVAEMERKLSAVSVPEGKDPDSQTKDSQAQPASSGFSQQFKDLEAQLAEHRQVVGSLSREKDALRQEVHTLREHQKHHLPSLDLTDIPDLKVHHQSLLKAIKARNSELEKMRKKEIVEQQSSSQSQSPRNTQQPSNDQRSSLLELCAENRVLLEAVAGGNSILQEMQERCSTASPTTASPLAKTSANVLHTAPSSQESRSGKDENERLTRPATADGEAEILGLEQSLKDLQQEGGAASGKLSDSVSQWLQRLQALIAEKNNELAALQQENLQLMSLCELSKAGLSESQMTVESLQSQLHNSEDVAQLFNREPALQHSSSSRSSKPSDALDGDPSRVERLEKELSAAEEEVSSHKAGIQDLNTRCAQLTKSLEEETARKSTLEDMVAMLQLSTDTAQAQLKHSLGYLSTEQRAVVLGEEETPIVPSSPLPAIEYHKNETGKDKNKTAEVLVQNGEVSEKQRGASERQEEVLRQQLREKEETVADLQQNNATLLQMLEARSLTSGTDGASTQADVHRLQGQVKALQVEKEQMLAVMNDKSREASSLKAEVGRLMSVVSAERQALDKRDNQELHSARPSPPRDDESLETMTRQAMQNLSRLVRDREQEIEALKQKNDTLMAVLQDMNQESGSGTGGGGAATGDSTSSSPPSSSFSSPHLAAHLADKENLEKQVATLTAEREQMVAFCNQKYSESLTYHAEIQRLTALRTEETARLERLQTDYDALRPQFEDKNHTLLKVQNDLINYRQKFAELEVKHGELLQRSSASETVDAASFRQVEEEKERLGTRQGELQGAVTELEDRLRATSERLTETENALLGKESEAGGLRKQVDSLTFQLQGVQGEAADLRQETQQAQHSQQENQSQSQTLQDLNNRLTLAVREKEFEVTSLGERVQKLSALLSEQQGEATQVSQLLQHQEAAAQVTARLQQEADHLTLALKQKQAQLNDMQAENLRLKEKEQKLTRELERLRGHLLQIEEGYTREALEAEEREKTLRNRLAQAEEHLASSATRVQSASQHASQQVESLQQQLHSVASQRDAAYMQSASLTDQCQQYAASLSNLQLVLEQFQREKETQVASETERYQEEAGKLKERVARLEKELNTAKVDLEEATDGLAAASRLSEQLDRKEEALQAMREEVHNRELALTAAEEEIHKLTSSKEAKVDRQLMKNLLLGYFHTPDRNRVDAIHAIGSVLGFSQEDFHKIDGGMGGGWMTSLFGRTRTPGATPPTTPSGPKRGPNHSFSQLFVKFLEVESTPPPAPVRLPAEEMARDAQERHHVKGADSHHKPAFNPFTAPRHVSMPIAVGAAAMATGPGSSSHLWMSTPPGSPTTSFPVFAPFTSLASSPSEERTATPQNSSAILKDVLGSR